VDKPNRPKLTVAKAEQERVAEPKSLLDQWLETIARNCSNAKPN
jgi:hypothetical protein